MTRGQGSVVAGVHGLEHVESLGAAALADDDPVGAHAQGVSNEVPHRHPTGSFGVGGPGFEPHDVGPGQAQLGRVLDGHHALVVADDGGKGVEQRRLAGSGSPRHHEVPPGPDHPAQQLGYSWRAERGQRHGPGGEPADGETGSVDRQRRNHGVDPGAVGQAGVDQWGRTVDPQSERGHDPLDEKLHQGPFQAHPGVGQRAGTLDPDRAVADAQYVGDRRVGQQWLERAQSGAEPPGPRDRRGGGGRTGHGGHRSGGRPQGPGQGAGYA